jgi:hypothetical protein
MRTAWYGHPLSTGPLVGINNTIGALQRRACGYRNDDHMKERLLPLHHTKCTRQGEKKDPAPPNSRMNQILMPPSGSDEFASTATARSGHAQDSL